MEFPGIWEQSPLARMQIALIRYRQEQVMDPNVSYLETLKELFVGYHHHGRAERLFVEK